MPKKAKTSSYQYKLCVSHKLRGKLIGKNGASIKAIKETSHARIDNIEYGFLIRGTQVAVNKAINQIKAIMEPEF
jgi:rRNA processing protein Krr1/Pno1